MARVLTDFHHSSLLRATNMLFQDRLGMTVFRPIGLDWFDQGFWAINDQRDTAEQFLSLDQGYRPADGTPPLNSMSNQLIKSGAAMPEGMYFVEDPGGKSFHRACTLDFFTQKPFDYVIASIPAHVPLFERLIAEYQPKAKLIVQIGNEWPAALFDGHNVLASIAPRPLNANVHFYHQEFDLDIFHPAPIRPTKKIYSFVNILQKMPQGWTDFTELEKLLPDYEFKSFGGQCRDGNMNGPVELANAMREAQFILHSKPGGDGFGHILHNAYAVGRPVIARPSQYRGQLGEMLMAPFTYLNLDKYPYEHLAEVIRQSENTELAEEMAIRAAERFDEIVNYHQIAEEVGEWLSSL